MTPMSFYIVVLRNFYKIELYLCYLYLNQKMN